MSSVRGGCLVPEEDQDLVFGTPRLRDPSKNKHRLSQVRAAPKRPPRLKFAGLRWFLSFHGRSISAIVYSAVVFVLAVVFRDHLWLVFPAVVLLSFFAAPKRS